MASLAIFSTSESGIGLPVGLFGLQRKMSLVFGVTDASTSSAPTEKSSGFRRTYLIRAPITSETTRNME